MKNADQILLDTNVLVYGHQEQSEFYTVSRSILRRGFEGNLPVCVCPQVLTEFYSTITNPKRVTDPAPPGEAVEEVEKYLRSLKILKIYSGEDSWWRTVSLLRQHEPRGMRVFDLQLVATMLSNQVTRICTFNGNDFLRFTEVKVLNPLHT